MLVLCGWKQAAGRHCLLWIQKAEQDTDGKSQRSGASALFLDFLPPSSPFSLLFHEDWWISPFDNPDSFQYIPGFFPKSLWMGSYSFQSNDFCLMISDKDQNRLHVCTCAQSLSRVQLFAAPGTVAHQAPLSTEFSRQEYWSGLLFPSPGDFPHPGIKSSSLATAGGSFTTSATWEAQIVLHPYNGLTRH